MKSFPKAALLVCLALSFGPSARAHDPYEITSVVYLQSNRIELFVELEFPTGMTLAGQKPTRDVATLSQFEAALPQLRKLAGGFYDFTAGNHVVPALATNVELGVEDHIRFRVDYATTPHRPLRFVARGLGGNADENPYGASLTVLDMVHKKVLGQTTLFAASAPAEFPPRNQESPDAVVMAVETNIATLTAVETTQPTDAPSQPATNKARPPEGSRWSAVVFFAGLALILYHIFRRRF
jgi:hypothetical protein